MSVDHEIVSAVGTKLRTRDIVPIQSADLRLQAPRSAIVESGSVGSTIEAASGPELIQSFNERLFGSKATVPLVCALERRLHHFLESRIGLVENGLIEDKRSTFRCLLAVESFEVFEA